MLLRPSSALLVLACVGLALARPQQQQQQQQQQQPQQQQSTSPPIAILKQNREFTDDGKYNYHYETENGIRVQEESSLQDVPAGLNIRQGPGQDGDENSGPRTVVVTRGSFSYTAPDGTPINLSYVADQNGFQPVGDHLPTPPPIPEAIQRALKLLPQVYQGEQEEQGPNFNDRQKRQDIPYYYEY